MGEEESFSLDTNSAQVEIIKTPISISSDSSMEKEFAADDSIESSATVYVISKSVPAAKGSGKFFLAKLQEVKGTVVEAKPVIDKKPPKRMLAKSYCGHSRNTFTSCATDPVIIENKGVGDDATEKVNQQEPLKKRLRRKSRCVLTWRMQEFLENEAKERNKQPRAPNGRFSTRAKRLH